MQLSLCNIVRMRCVGTYVRVDDGVHTAQAKRPISDLFFSTLALSHISCVDVQIHSSVLMSTLEIYGTCDHASCLNISDQVEFLLYFI